MKHANIPRLSRRQACGSLGAWLSLSAFSLAPCGRSPIARAPFPRVDLRAFLDAVQRGDLERVQAALAEEPELARGTDDLGRSAFVLAHLRGHRDVARALSESGLELDLVESVLAEDWPRFEELAALDPEQLASAHPFGGTPLHAAALVGSHGCWRLRSAGCLSDANPAGGSGFTPARTAMEAARSSWANIALTDLCSNGANINAAQRNGSSVLHGAVERQDVSLVTLAIRKGADPEARNDAGRTPLEVARELGWQAGVLLLLNHTSLPRDNRDSRFALDANREAIQRPSMDGLAPALQSEVTGASHFNLKKVKELVASDARLVFSISSDDELAIEACAHIGSKDVMRFHLDHGAPFSLPTAVSLGDAEMVRFWLDQDPELLNERGAHDFPLMWYVVMGGSIEMGELLLERGADVDQESMGTTALHWCIRRSNPELLSWLLERGADPERVGLKWDRDGQTPLQLAASLERQDMRRQLKGAGARIESTLSTDS